MKRVSGIGGIFFKSDDPKKLYEWYETHLGIQCSPDGSGAMFEWREIDDDAGGKKPAAANGDPATGGTPEKAPANTGMTIWSIFPRSSKYFDPSRSSFMINYRVDDLDALLAALKEEGVEIDPHREDFDYGRFAWIMDPEGNRIELWEPPKNKS
jgi:catechol 2,3-dioxygenase-like lactoylglutathione lyase family enzyme